METHLVSVLVSGGPVMLALAVLSLLLYKSIISLLLFVRGLRLDEFIDRRVAQTTLAAETSDPDALLKERIAFFDETLWQLKQLVRSRLKYTRALLVASPLLGLLGTVIGMLDTFHGLSLNLGHETARTVADGISRALITTETGLMVAIPALFFINWIKRETQRHELRLLERKMALLSRVRN